MTLHELETLLADLADDIDQADEEITNHRHATNDPARAAQLRAIGDDLTTAWAAMRRALVTLNDLRALP